MASNGTQHDKEGLPAELISDDIRLRTEGVTRTEVKINNGNYFVGSSKREDVPTPDTYSSVVTAGVGGLVIEDLLITINFGNLTNGHVNIIVVAYVAASSGNDWTYTTSGTITPVGRSVNTGFINTFPGTTIDSGVTVNTLTGDADYPLYFVDYLIDTSANRNMLSTDKSEFFSGDRKIVVAAGEQVLVQTLVVGVATGTVDFSSIFFTSEPSE